MDIHEALLPPEHPMAHRRNRSAQETRQRPLSLIIPLSASRKSYEPYSYLPAQQASTPVKRKPVPMYTPYRSSLAPAPLSCDNRDPAPPPRPRRPTKGLFDDVSHLIGPLADAESASVPRNFGQVDSIASDDKQQQDTGVSEDVKQLMSEVDRAFDEVEGALSELKLDSFVVQPSPKDKPLPPPPALGGVVDINPASKDKRKLRLSLQLVRSAAIQKLPALERSKTNASETKARNRALTWPKALQSSSGRRGMADAVLGLMAKHGLGRVEADEIITPERVQELRKSREVPKSWYRPSMEADGRSSRTSSSIYSPTAPDTASPRSSQPHSQITDYGIDDMVLSPTEVIEPANTSKLGSGNDTNDEQKHPSKAMDNPECSQVHLESNDGVNPQPSVKRPARHIASLQGAPLSTIPETIAALRGNGKLQQGKGLRIGIIPRRTSTMRTRGPKTPSPENFNEEDVDWSQFQLAILGGTDNLAQGMAEDDEREMGEDTAEWFEGFGFESHGELIPNVIPLLRGPSQSMDSYTSAVSSDSEVDDEESTIPDGTIRRISTPVKSRRPKVSRANSSYVATGEVTIAGVPVLYVEENPNAPPEAVDPTSESAKRVSSAELNEPVQMSCNLTADLGDFLVLNPSVME